MPPFLTTKQYKQLFKFLLQALISFCLNFSVLIFMKEVAGLPPQYAYAVALLTVLVTNFFLCRYFVFEGRQGHPLTQGGVFVVSSIVFRAAEFSAYYLLLRILEVPYWLLFFPVQGGSFLVKFFWYAFVFNVKSGSDEL